MGKKYCLRDMNFTFRRKELTMTDSMLIILHVKNYFVLAKKLDGAGFTQCMCVCWVQNGA